MRLGGGVSSLTTFLALHTEFWLVLGVRRQDLMRSPACQTNSLRAHGCRCRKQELALSGGQYQGDGFVLNQDQNDIQKPTTSERGQMCGASSA